MRRPTLLACVVTFAAGTAAGLHGMFITPEISTVPIDRLTSNLERRLKAHPSDVQLRINLARLHGMAYALKTNTAEAVTQQGNLEAWYGNAPNPIPYLTKAAASAQQAAEAKKHLKAAIAEYERALKLDPNNLTGRLGHAWALDQAGDKRRAIAEYRRVIQQAWPKESRKTTANIGEPFFTSEAAGYLIPLLSPTSDAAEIAQLQERREQLQQIRRPITPIAVALADVGSNSAMPPIDSGARVRFDADGSGFVREWTWLTPEAGWLVHDPLRTGSITSALQLFGNVSFWLFWQDGYEALRALDDDDSGRLEGPELAGLAVWRDANHNGRSDPGEVLPLAAADIVSVSVAALPGATCDVAAWSPDGIRLKNGRTRPTWDVILRPARRR